MTISLPYLFAAGLFAAPVGLLLLLAQLRWPNRAVFLAGLLGGVAAWLVQQYILAAIGEDFMGWYKPAAWLNAFFAGYAAAALLAHGLRLSLSGRRVSKKP